MKTKQLFAIILALSMAWMTSCTDKDSGTGTAVPGSTRTLSFNLTTDARVQTRAASTTPPDVTNHKVQYILQVLNADGSNYGSQEVNDTGTFEVELPVGVTYTCLFWAQYIPTAGGSPESAYFNTTDLKAVALKDVLTAEDQCQAFCATADVTASQAAATNTVILKRAVAQVNLRSNEDLKYYDKIEARYSDVPNTFNVQDGTVSTNGSTGVPSTFTITNTDITPDGGKFTFHSVYFLARGDGNANLLSIDIDTYNTGESTPIQTLTVPNVPTKKNYKTNVTATLDAASFTHNFTFDFAEWEASELEPPSKLIWDGVTPVVNNNYAFSGGSGVSVSDPYLISTAADFVQLRKNVNDGNNYSGKYFKMTENLDLDKKPWSLVNGTFSGHFDGDHHTLKGIEISSTAATIGGVFIALSEGSINNIHVYGDITSLDPGGSITGVGGIVGSAQYASTNIIKGCSFHGNIKYEKGYGGGICGNADSNTQIVGCANYGAVTAMIAGGILGNRMSGFSATACYNTGAITSVSGTGSSAAGGITANSNDNITGCFNTGTITIASGTNIGAISGYSSSFTCTDCYVLQSYTQVGSDEKVFANGIWPNASTNAVWTVDTNPDGSTNKYWKSIGGWNGGSPEYPKLWWEE